MGHLQACGHVPVNMAHVVVQLVLAQIGQVDASASQERAVIALQKAVEPAHNCPFQAAQDAVCPGNLRGIGGLGHRRCDSFWFSFEQAEHRISWAISSRLARHLSREFLVFQRFGRYRNFGHDFGRDGICRQAFG